MSAPSNPPHSRRPRPWLPLVGLLLALLFATGPGVLLVNRPETVLGLPWVYAWGIFWFLVICGIALATDRWIWQREMEESSDPEPPAHD